MTDRRVVFDTNTLVSYFIITESTPGRAVRKATSEAVLLASEATLGELAEVLFRRKSDAYGPVQERTSFIRLIAATVELVTITGVIQACRDPRDDKFLDVAVNGRADFIVTGDKDLLALDPFHGVRIVTPAQYLAE